MRTTLIPFATVSVTTPSRVPRVGSGEDSGVISGDVAVGVSPPVGPVGVDGVDVDGVVGVGEPLGPTELLGESLGDGLAEGVLVPAVTLGDGEPVGVGEVPGVVGVDELVGVDEGAGVGLPLGAVLGAGEPLGLTLPLGEAEGDVVGAGVGVEAVTEGLGEGEGELVGAGLGFTMTMIGGGVGDGGSGGTIVGVDELVGSGRVGVDDDVGVAAVTEGLGLGVPLGATLLLGEGLELGAGVPEGVGVEAVADGEGLGVGLELGAGDDGTVGVVGPPGLVEAQMTMCEISLSKPWPPGSNTPLAFTSAQTTSPGAGFANTVLGWSVESLDFTLPALTMTLE